MHDAGLSPRVGRVDASDARVRVRAAMNRDVQRAGQRDVGDVASASGDESPVLASPHARAEETLTHSFGMIAAVG